SHEKQLSSSSGWHSPLPQLGHSAQSPGHESQPSSSVDTAAAQPGHAPQSPGQVLQLSPWSHTWSPQTGSPVSAVSGSMVSVSVSVSVPELSPEAESVPRWGSGSSSRS